MRGKSLRYLSAFFRSLFWRISATFLLLLVIMSIAYVYIGVFTAEMYFQEASQRLNAMVAEHIVGDIAQSESDTLDEKVLGELFHNVMIINPSIEVYLLDTEGTIMSYYAPQKTIKRASVSLEPIDRFLETRGTTFVMGDDPKNAEGEKVFSAARLDFHGTNEGYIYVILGGEEFESTVSFLLGSYILRLGVGFVIVSLLGASLVGLLAIWYITRNIRVIRRTVREFQSGNLEARISLPGKGELTDLADSFNRMSDTIVSQLEETRTMDTLRRELVANVSHDLRTPLAAIRGYAETILMKADSMSPEERHRHMTVILESTQQLQKLVEELFELSKLEAKQTKPNPEPFSMAELVQDVAQKFEVLAKRNEIRIRTELPRHLPQVTADIALIERALQNLVENAIKYTPSGGLVTVRLSSGENGVGVEVIDSGKGIPPEDLPFVFERFHRGQETAGKGAGLGLAIVKKILEVHGQNITVTSEQPKGTAFFFQLPASS